MVAIFENPIVIGVGVVFAALLVWMGLRWVSRKMSGWDGLARRFPARVGVQKLGPRFRVSAFFGGGGMNFGSARSFVVEFAKEGMLVTASFAKSSPILVPWGDIRDVSGIDGGGWGSEVDVVLNYDKRDVRFHFPGAALALFREHVAAERIGGMKSLGDAVRDRFGGRG